MAQKSNSPVIAGKIIIMSHRFQAKKYALQNLNNLKNDMARKMTNPIKIMGDLGKTGGNGPP